MRTNGFAFFRGPRAWARGREGTHRVIRYCRAVMVSSGPAFGPGGEGRRDAESCFVAYSLEKSGGLPLVHGFAEDYTRISEGESRGEFAFIAREGDGFVAGRDAMGTRALYQDDSGTCVASDHRFFDRPPRMVPRGAAIDLNSGETRFPQERPRRGVDGIEEAAATLGRLLDDSVALRVKGRRRVAVSFSGGLDSSIIALLASRHAEVVLCSAYAQGSLDSDKSARAAALLGLEHHGAVIADKEAATEMRALDLPFEPSPMDRALWCLYSTTARMASENGAELILLGQLADELFGGYMKYSLRARESEVSAIRMMERDIEGAAERGFVRDELACARFTEVGFPFADREVSSFASRLPLSYKIRRGERKAVLRLAASALGLPEELARAPKKAAQYSSGLSKIVI